MPQGSGASTTACSALHHADVSAKRSDPQDSSSPTAASHSVQPSSAPNGRFVAAPQARFLRNDSVLQQDMLPADQGSSNNKNNNDDDSNNSKSISAKNIDHSDNGNLQNRVSEGTGSSPDPAAGISRGEDPSEQQQISGQVSDDSRAATKSMYSQPPTSVAASESVPRTASQSEAVASMTLTSMAAPVPSATSTAEAAAALPPAQKVKSEDRKRPLFPPRAFNVQNMLNPSESRTARTEQHPGVATSESKAEMAAGGDAVFGLESRPLPRTRPDIMNKSPLTRPPGLARSGPLSGGQALAAFSSPPTGQSRLMLSSDREIPPPPQLPPPISAHPGGGSSSAFGGPLRRILTPHGPSLGRAGGASTSSGLPAGQPPATGQGVGTQPTVPPMSLMMPQSLGARNIGPAIPSPPRSFSQPLYHGGGSGPMTESQVTDPPHALHPQSYSVRDPSHGQRQQPGPSQMAYPPSAPLRRSIAAGGSVDESWQQGMVSGGSNNSGGGGAGGGSVGLGAPGSVGVPGSLGTGMGGLSMAMEEGQRYITITPTFGDEIRVPVDVHQASKQADEKRQRNAGASARFRARKKEKDREAQAGLQRLEAQNRELQKLVRELELQRDFYRNDRNRLQQLMSQNPSMRDLAKSPPSPVITTQPFASLDNSPATSGASLHQAQPSHQLQQLAPFPPQQQQQQQHQQQLQHLQQHQQHQQHHQQHQQYQLQPQQQHQHQPPPPLQSLFSPHQPSYSQQPPFPPMSTSAPSGYGGSGGGAANPAAPLTRPEGRESSSSMERPARRRRTDSGPNMDYSGPSGSPYSTSPAQTPRTSLPPPSGYHGLAPAPLSASPSNQRLPPLRMESPSMGGSSNSNVAGGPLARSAPSPTSAPGMGGPPLPAAYPPSSAPYSHQMHEVAGWATSTTPPPHSSSASMHYPPPHDQSQHRR